MKKHTMNAYRKLIGLIWLLGFFSVFLFTSCEDIQADASEEKTLSPSQAYTVFFSIADVAEDSSVGSGRNIYPKNIIVKDLSFLLQGEPIKPLEDYELPAENSETPIDWSQWEKDDTRTMDGDRKLLDGIQYPTKEKLDNASFNLDAGAWKFVLKAYYNDKYRVKNENGEYPNDPYELKDLRLTAVSYVEKISAGNNVITFNMKLAEENTELPDEYRRGSIKIILNCYLGADTCSHIGEDVVVSLTKYKDESTMDIDDTFSYGSIEKTIKVGASINDSSGKPYTPVTYETANTVPEGDYSIFIKIPLVYREDSQGNKKQTFATFRDTQVKVAPGSQSFLEKNLTDFKQRYTIEYKSVEETVNADGEKEYTVKDFTYFNDGVDVSEYNPSSKTPVELPRISDINFNNTDLNKKRFLAWYEGYDDENHFDNAIETSSFRPAELITQNEETKLKIQTGKKTFYARWGDLNIYVSKDGDDGTGTGSLAAPFKKLERALKMIRENPNSNLNWIINIIGTVTAGKAADILSVGDQAITAASITIKGYNEIGKDKNWVNADGLVTSTPNDPVLTVKTSFSVNLQYLTVTHSDGINGSGLVFGDVSNKEGEFSMSNVKVYNNNSGSTNGAGISNYCNLTIENCEISGNNTTGNGGGIYNEGTISITKSLISANKTEEDSANGNGGGIYNTGTLALSDDTEISGNSALQFGGGINNKGTLKISGSRVSVTGNEAKSGGGISNDDNGVFIMSAGTITGNKALDKNNNGGNCGGGVYNAATMFMYGSAVIGNAEALAVANNEGENYSNMSNFAYSQGGGIYNNGYLYLGYEPAGTDVDGNYIKEDGKYKAKISDSVSSCCVYYNYAQDGGGIYNEGTLDFYSGSVKYNATAGSGGGICIIKTGILKMSGTKAFIENNKANNGGGVSNKGATFNMDNGVIKDNEATASGGGVYNAILKETDSITSDVVTYTPKFNMTAGSIASNTASTSGGGVYNSGEFNFSDGFVLSNKSHGETTDDGGAGVYNAKDGSFIMSGGTISGNIAQDNQENSHGGGVYNHGNMTMTGNAIIGDASIEITKNAIKTEFSNYSCSDGGGIYNAVDGVLKLGTDTAPLNKGIYYNYSDSKGGGIFNDAAQANVTVNSGNILRNGANKTNFSGLGGTAITKSENFTGEIQN